MYVLVLPVSGGGFVSQLAILQHLCASDFIPDLTLASSGGNVAAYVAAAANWKWPGIERVASALTQDLFVAPRSNISLVAMLMGYFAGDMYNKGIGVHGLLAEHFTQESITRHEIWTGTYNKSLQKTRLYCNRSAANSLLSFAELDYELTQSMEPVFANGDMEIIAQAGVASASIPGIVPAEIIEGHQYIDGGVGSASPLTVMYEPIINYVQQHQTPLHMIYVNSINLSSLTDSEPCRNVFDTWRQATDELVRSQTVTDRLAAYNLLRQLRQGTTLMHKNHFACNYKNMERLRLIKEKIKYFLLEIYPAQYISVKLTKFTGADVIDAIRQAHSLCHCCLWWIAPDNSTDLQMVNDIIAQCERESSNECALVEL